MIACVRERDLALRLWRGLRTALQENLDLTLARGLDELRARSRSVDPHLVLLEADALDDLRRVRAVLEHAPRATLLLHGEGARVLRSEVFALPGLDSGQRSRVILLEDLLQEVGSGGVAAGAPSLAPSPGR